MSVLDFLFLDNAAADLLVDGLAVLTKLLLHERHASRLVP